MSDEVTAGFDEAAINEMRHMFRKQVVKIRLARKTISEQSYNQNGPSYQDFNLDIFWRDYYFTALTLSHGVTRLSVILTSKGWDDAGGGTQSAVTGVHSALETFVALNAAVPQHLGHQFCCEIRSSSLHIIDSLEEYFMTIFRDPTNAAQAGAVGVVWERCSLQDVPRTASKHCLKVLTQQQELVADATAELHSELRMQRSMRKSRAVRSGAAEEPWSLKQMERAEAALKLVKAVGALIRRATNPHTGQISWLDCPPSQLDPIVVSAPLISSSVDDLVASVYPPIHVQTMNTLISELEENVGKVLDRIGDAGRETSSVWFDWAVEGRRELGVTCDRLRRTLLPDLSPPTDLTIASDLSELAQDQLTINEDDTPDPD